MYNAASGVVKFLKRAKASFTESSAHGSGGHIYNEGALIFRNTGYFAEGYSNGSGGAIFSRGTMQFFKHVDFIDNTANAHGGAIASTFELIDFLPEDVTYSGNFRTEVSRWMVKGGSEKPNPPFSSDVFFCCPYRSSCGTDHPALEVYSQAWAEVPGILPPLSSLGAMPREGTDVHSRIIDLACFQNILLLLHSCVAKTDDTTAKTLGRRSIQTPVLGRAARRRLNVPWTCPSPAHRLFFVLLVVVVAVSSPSLLSLLLLPQEAADSDFECDNVYLNGSPDGGEDGYICIPGFFIDGYAS